MNEEQLCDVCNERPMFAVAASPLAAVSLAYCKKCLDEKREPYRLLVVAVMCNEMSTDLREPMGDYMHATLLAAGKTREDLVNDAEELLKDFAENAE